MVGHWEEPVQGSARVHLPTQTTAEVGAVVEPMGCISRAVVVNAPIDRSGFVLNTVGSDTRRERQSYVSRRAGEAQRLERHHGIPPLPTLLAAAAQAERYPQIAASPAPTCELST